jgi:ribonuclease BN (tRNA processing enzyme)
MKVRFLGTNGWFDTKAGNTVCTLLETKHAHIVLDAGNGIHKLDKYITDSRPIYLFISHFHLDHIAGLHVLSKFNFSQGINIIGQAGTKAALADIFKAPYSVPFSQLPYEVRILEVGAGIHSVPFPFTALPLLHIHPTFGYRLELDNRKLAYCCDTGPCRNLAELGRDADMLITECALRAGEKLPGWPHLNPQDAAKAALAADAKRLVLTHLDPVKYPDAASRLGAQTAAREIFRNTQVAQDDGVIEI